MQVQVMKRFMQDRTYRPTSSMVRVVAITLLTCLLLACAGEDIGLPEVPLRDLASVRLIYIDLEPQETIGGLSNPLLATLKQSLMDHNPDLVVFTSVPVAQASDGCENCPVSPLVTGLLPTYTWSCNGNAQTCIASNGRIELQGCPSGQCTNLPQHIPAASWRCNDDTSLAGTRAIWPNGALIEIAIARLPAGRPPMAITAYTDDTSATVDQIAEHEVAPVYKELWRNEYCRQSAFGHIFSGSLGEPGSLGNQGSSLLLGQLGLDPYRQLSSNERIPGDLFVWDSFVSAGVPGEPPTAFGYMSGIDTGIPILPTRRSNQAVPTWDEATLAHVVATHQVRGSCMPLDGQTPPVIATVLATPIDATTPELLNFAFICDIEVEDIR